MTCKVCGGPVSTLYTEELAPEQIRRRHVCRKCGRSSISLQLEMGNIVRVPKESAVKILERAEEDLKTLKPLLYTSP